MSKLEEYLGQIRNQVEATACNKNLNSFMGISFFKALLMHPLCGWKYSEKDADEFIDRLLSGEKIELENGSVVYACSGGMYIGDNVE